MLLTGPSGAGKSHLLQAIAAAASNIKLPQCGGIHRVAGSSSDRTLSASCEMRTVRVVTLDVGSAVSMATVVRCTLCAWTGQASIALGVARAPMWALQSLTEGGVRHCVATATGTGACRVGVRRWLPTRFEARCGKRRVSW